MPEQTDAFSGTWRFDPHRSKFSTPPPQSWIQQITISGNEISVREEIVRAGGPPMTVSVHAQFDGKDYPVSGSPGADSIAYSRVSEREIVGTGKKNGAVTLKEAIRLNEDGTMSLSYSIWSGDRELASGQAMFRKENLKPDAHVR
jgi:hypothetical protein